MGGFFDPKEQDTQTSVVQQADLHPMFEEWMTTQGMPAYSDALSRAQTIGQTPLTLPDSPLHAPTHPMAIQGMRGIRKLAESGGATAPAAIDQLNATLRGDYLQPEAIEMATRGAVNRISPSINANFFGQSGGGALRGAAMTEAIGNVMSDYYAGERGRQLQGLSLAPRIEQLAYSPHEQILRGGEYWQRAEDQDLAENLYRHQYPTLEEASRFGQYANTLQGLTGTFSGMFPHSQTQVTSGTAYGPSPFQTALGAAGSIVGLGGPAGLNLWGGSPAAAAPAIAGGGAGFGAPAGSDYWLWAG